MATRASYGKREREKLKANKRQEKQKRKESNQNSQGSSFDDMIAYVDEFGRLHSTPPTKEKEQIDASTIEVAVPRREDIESAPFSGRVEYFNDSKGFGFIVDSMSGEKFFFHINSAPQNIAEGDKVTFTTEKRDRGMTAVDIEIINQ